MRCTCRVRFQFFEWDFCERKAEQNQKQTFGVVPRGGPKQSMIASRLLCPTLISRPIEYRTHFQ